MMTDKKETVFERLHKLGAQNTADIMVVAVQDFIKESQDKYGQIDHYYVAGLLCDFLKAPADDYYLCSAQEANIGDTKDDEYEQRIKNFSAKYANELTELRVIIGNEDLQVFVDDEYKSEPGFCVLNGNGDWIDTYYGYDLALANIKTLLEISMRQKGA